MNKTSLNYNKTCNVTPIRPSTVTNYSSLSNFTNSLHDESNYQIIELKKINIFSIKGKWYKEYYSGQTVLQRETQGVLNTLAAKN
jgi:predicted lactoylglutathione lyase